MRVLIAAITLISFASSTMAVTTQDLENELDSLGMSAGTIVWTTARLQAGEKKLKAFTKLRVVGAVVSLTDCRPSMPPALCEKLSLNVQTDDGYSLTLNLGPSATWMSGANGTFARALTKNNPQRGYQKWSKSVLEAIAASEVLIGMTSAQARTSWGYPDDKRVTITKRGTSEQWIYGRPLSGASYLYLENDKVVAVQN